MSEFARDRMAKSLPRRWAGIALLAAALAVVWDPANAQPQPGPPPQRCALLESPPAETTAALERILGRIKELYPNGHILLLRRSSLDLEGRRLTYDVKVLPVDGRIVWLTFDARTLEPLNGPRGRPVVPEPDRDCRTTPS